MCKRGTSSISDYLNRFKAICELLAAIQKDVSDDDKVMYILDGLDMVFVTSVSMRVPFPPFSELRSLLLGARYKPMPASSSDVSSTDLFYWWSCSTERKERGDFSDSWRQRKQNQTANDLPKTNPCRPIFFQLMGIFVFPSVFLVIGDGIGCPSTDVQLSRCLTGEGKKLSCGSVNYRLELRVYSILRNSLSPGKVLFIELKVACIFLSG